MNNDGTAKIQHYVPQFLLRNWGTGKKDQIHVYDKTTEKEFSTNIKNIAGENYFYEIRTENESISLEKDLSQIESNAKPIIKKIIQEESTINLTNIEKQILSIFLSAQLTRTRHYRNQLGHLRSEFRAHLLKFTKDESSLGPINEYIRPLTKEEEKASAMIMMTDATINYPPHFQNKIWLLAKTNKLNPFMISDNPITLQNSSARELRGNLGLAVKGIEIYFPLSPIHALALWCPSHLEPLYESHARITYLMTKAPTIVHKLLPEFLYTQSIISAIKNGTPLEYNASNTLNFNALQIYNSERYVFSNTKNFALPKEMIKSDIRYKNGPRLRIS